MVFDSDEKCCIKVNKDKPAEKSIGMRGSSKGQTGTSTTQCTGPRELRYVVGSKFILQGDKIKQNNGSDEQVLERRGLLSQVDGETGDIV